MMYDMLHIVLRYSFSNYYSCSKHVIKRGEGGNNGNNVRIVRWNAAHHALSRNIRMHSLLLLSIVTSDRPIAGRGSNYIGWTSSPASSLVRRRRLGRSPRPAPSHNIMSPPVRYRPAPGRGGWCLSSSAGRDDDDDDEGGDGGDDGVGSSGIDGPILDADTYLRAECEFLGPDGYLYIDNDGGGDGDRRDRSTREGGGWRREGGAVVGSGRDWQRGGMPPAAVGGLHSQSPSYYYVDPPDDDVDDNPDDDRSTSFASRRRSSDVGSPYYSSIEDSEGDGAVVGDGESFAEDARTLHERVFLEERAYLEQSEGFRKMLSSAMDENEVYNDESPMATSRREEIERYNEGVIDKLMREMDEMEEGAMSREEAMGYLADNDQEVGRRVASSSSDIAEGGVSDERVRRRRDDDIRCSKCGLRVTPDMIQRAEAIEVIYNKDGDGKRGRARGVRGEGASVRRRYGNDVATSGGGIAVCCSACYGMRFRTTNEATVRTAIWSGGGGSSSSFVGGRYNPPSSSSSKMFDGKRNDGDGRRSWSSNNDHGYDGGKEKWNKSRSINAVQGIDTATLFDVPGGGYNSEMQGRSSLPSKVPIDGTSPANPNVIPPKGGGSAPDYRRRRSSPPRRTPSFVGGGGELARRMRRDAESRNEDDPVEGLARNGRTFGTGTMAVRTTTASNNVGDGVSLGGAIREGNINGHVPNANDDDGADERTKINNDIDQRWIKVEDPDSKRILYWNTDTGEMKKYDVD
jgi:hypothetical protein